MKQPRFPRIILIGVASVLWQILKSPVTSCHRRGILPQEPPYVNHCAPPPDTRSIQGDLMSRSCTCCRGAAYLISCHFSCRIFNVSRIRSPQQCRIQSVFEWYSVQDLARELDPKSQFSHLSNLPSHQSTTLIAWLLLLKSCWKARHKNRSETDHGAQTAVKSAFWKFAESFVSFWSIKVQNVSERHYKHRFSF